MCVSGSKKCSFFRKFWFILFSCYLRFEIHLLPYYRNFPALFQMTSIEVKQNIDLEWVDWHYIRSVRIRTYSDPYFPTFGLNILSECGKIRTRITANTDTFYAVILYNKQTKFSPTFAKKLHLRCLTDFWIHIWFWQDLNEIK